MDRMTWKDGWHELGCLQYLIEDGKIIRGVLDGSTVYPYLPCKTGGLDNVSGITANKRNFEKLVWR